MGREVLGAEGSLECQQTPFPSAGAPGRCGWLRFACSGRSGLVVGFQVFHVLVQCAVRFLLSPWCLSVLKGLVSKLRYREAW